MRTYAHTHTCTAHAHRLKHAATQTLTHAGAHRRAGTYFQTHSNSDERAQTHTQALDDLTPHKRKRKHMRTRANRCTMQAEPRPDARLRREQHVRFCIRVRVIVVGPGVAYVSVHIAAAPRILYSWSRGACFLYAKLRCHFFHFRGTGVPNF